MVTIITGPINSGKTTKIQEVYKKVKNGDGFVCLKLMESSIVKGFDMMRLSTGKKKPFIRKSGSEPKDWDKNCTLGPYTVSDEAVEWVVKVIDKLLLKGKGPLFLDEIGHLEINGKCFSNILHKMIDSGRDVYITVRDEKLEDVLEKFDILEPDIIKSGERYA